jgi:hypothetical protein
MRSCRDAVILLVCLTDLMPVHAFAPLIARSTIGLHARPSLACRGATSFTQAPPFLHGPMTKTIILSLPYLPTLPSKQSLAAWWYLTLLAVLVGAQPFFMKKYIPKTICRSTVVLMQEVAKFVTAAGLLWVSGGWTASFAGTRRCHEYWRVAAMSHNFSHHRLVSTGLGGCRVHTSSHLRRAKLLYANGLSGSSACSFFVGNAYAQ